MKYKIAICDDSDADRQYVLNMVDRWAASAGHVVHTDTFTSAENFLFHYAEESDYDILLLDIEMGAMDGVTMAKQLRKNNDTVQIVFITDYSDYISEGYEVAALHYLMKPVKEEKLCSVLDRAAEKLSKNEKVLNFEISESARRAIEKTVLEHGMKYREVVTWSTDGFFRETKEKVAYRKSEGCSVVEMECSALASCSSFRGATFGMILYTADSLADVDKYDERNWGGNAYEYALTLCLDAVIKL